MPDSPWSIDWHRELPSTMTRARELAVAGAPAGRVVVADYQSAGRGTRGRIWLAEPGTCLMFTVLLRPALAPGALEMLPRQVSESLADALHAKLGLACVVKEPNDILVHGRKLCGVLCTSQVHGSSVEWVLCGIGLNTNMAADQLPLETATSLLAEGVAVLPHNELLALLLGSLTWLLGN
jgi:BirA family transcriptional regulator, biotin operon repressor / biotin---[acetyl-CoA-carboxylase] ligase